ncbi:MAG: hypothetical protein CVT92_13865 [Bacteroidetes bacterium HGW-Bacteroidetes-1]|nr:MAG: hypothetical protein CVT92_13865 [Bacteroidetes bacterium HGW-Bacteroidetes-1]
MLLTFSIQSAFAQSGITNIYTETTSSASGTSYTTIGAAGSLLVGKTYDYRYGANSDKIDNQLSLLANRKCRVSIRRHSGSSLSP